MANYFSYLPNIRYLSRSLDRNSIDETTDVKNLFRRARIRTDQSSVVYGFDDFYIPGNLRPDQLSEQIYENADYDWVILMANNIIDIRDQWPMDDLTFQKYLLTKYKTQSEIASIHHYETTEQLDDFSRVIVPAGLIVDSNFDMSYLERNPERQVEISYSNVGSGIPEATTVDSNGTARDTNGTIIENLRVTPITNYEFETNLNDFKRNIVLPKREYISTFVSDLERIMSYDTKASETINRKTKSVSNSRFTGK
ncbi:MAG: hypothetical protein CL855_08440 [Cryomorphaceae bacterium]|nr:hypothetical protein [Cryomorphaceae bacterium]|tara:strand:+ start:552 stop:1313 length:762 start_codon:yes stop_codon:yes gene_type:complete